MLLKFQIAPHGETGSRSARKVEPLLSSTKHLMEHLCPLGPEELNQIPKDMNVIWQQIPPCWSQSRKHLGQRQLDIILGGTFLGGTPLRHYKSKPYQSWRADEGESARIPCKFGTLYHITNFKN